MKDGEERDAGQGCTTARLACVVDGAVDRAVEE